MPLDLSQLTPEQLQALLAQNSSSASQTPDVDAALSTPTPPPAAPDRSGLADKITDYINAKTPPAAIQNELDAAAGKPGSMSGGDATITSQNTDLPTDVDTDSDHDTGLSPSVDAKLSAMTQPARDALAKGPDATPDADDSDEDDEDEDESPVKGGPIAKNGPGPATAGAPAAAAGPKDYLGDMLSKLYGSGTDAASLQRAMQQRQQNNMINNLGMADQMVAAGLSRGHYKPDYSVNAEIAKQNDQPVNNILMQRKAAEEQIGTALKAADFNDKSQQQDPTSPLSAATRQMAATLNPQMAKTPGFQNLDYESIVKQQPMIDTYMKAQMYQAMKASMMQNKQAQQESKAEFDVPNKISNFINNRGATKLAADADRRVDNLTSLTAMYPDLDKMPQNQVHLFTDELAQIATGGVAREGSTAQLMSPTLMSGMKQLLSKGTDNVTGADMGAFLKEYQPYLQDLQSNARAYVGDQIKPLVAGASKSIQDPVAYNELKSGYDKYLSASDARKQRQQDQSQTKQALSQVAPSPKSSPAATPDDAKAIAWAKQVMTSTDPKMATPQNKAMALQFLKMNGS